MEQVEGGEEERRNGLVLGIPLLFGIVAFWIDSC